MGGGVLIPEFRRLPPTRSCVRTNNDTSQQGFKATDERLIGEPCITCGSKYICNCDKEKFVQPPLMMAVPDLPEEEDETAKIAQDLGGLMCGCSPEKNYHMQMPIAPAGMCPFCGVEGPLHQQAVAAKMAGDPEFDGLLGIKDLGMQQVSKTDDLDRFEFTDWDAAWNEEPTNIEWLLEPLLERGTANVIYSDAGIGKSLVALEAAASIAQVEPVLYVVSENRRRDHRDRLMAMGYTPAKLKNLHMLSFPELPPLDKHEGGDVLLRLAKKVGAALVVIDTTMRFVDGKENDADTFNAMYKHTMLPLKGAGICSLRLDHEGKDASRGQRGSSGKRGDVDSVWRLTHPDKGSNRWLENEKDRSHHYPDKIRLELEFTPFGHGYHWDKDYLNSPSEEQGSCYAVTVLREAGVTPEMTVREARNAVTAARKKMSQGALVQALRELKLVTDEPRNAA